MLSTTKSQAAFMWAIILALIFVSASLYASDFKIQGYTTPAYIDLQASEVRVGESAGTVTLNIIRSGDYRQTSIIDFQTSENEASEGRDYKGMGGTVTFQPGESSKNITLSILSDDEIEAAESFVFAITGSDPNTTIGLSSTTVWIDDNPIVAEQPKLEISPAGDGSILLSWEAARPCSLERSATPGDGPWEPVTCNPVVKDGRYEVIQPVGGVFYAFRLRAD